VFRAVLMSCSFAEAQAIAAPVIDRLVSLDRHWDCFLSARAALTLGQPAIAAPIFRNLAPRVHLHPAALSALARSQNTPTKVESESLNSWLRALCLLSRSEAALSSLPSASAPLPDAILASFYHALTALQVSGVGGSHGRTVSMPLLLLSFFFLTRGGVQSSKKKGGGRSFQQAFVQLRVEFLGSAFRVLACLRELPRSAFTRPSPKEIEAGRLRLASEQVARCVASLHSVALAYAHLAHCHFDIDNLSLDTLEVYSFSPPQLVLLFLEHDHPPSQAPGSSADGSVGGIPHGPRAQPANVLPGPTPSVACHQPLTWQRPSQRPFSPQTKAPLLLLDR